MSDEQPKDERPTGGGMAGVESNVACSINPNRNNDPHYIAFMMTRRREYTLRALNHLNAAIEVLTGLDSEGQSQDLYNIDSEPVNCEIRQLATVGQSLAHRLASQYGALYSTAAEQERVDKKVRELKFKEQREKAQAEKQREWEEAHRGEVKMAEYPAAEPGSDLP